MYQLSFISIKSRRAPQYDSYVAPTELQISTSYSNYKYFVPPGLKIHELHGNFSGKHSSDRSEISVAMHQY